MRIAMPDWDGFISPVLDTATRFLVIDLERESVARTETVVLVMGDAVQRVLQMMALRIDMLICCSVSHALEAAIASHGVRVIRHICGPVDAVLESYMVGGMIPQCFIMPGCRVSGRMWEHLPE